MHQSGLSGDRTDRPLQQRTLKNRIHCWGVSLHHGTRVTMTLVPALPDTGIVFRRTDIAGGNCRIAASWQNIADMPHCSALTTGGGVVIATVEHLLAALAGAGIDNLLVEVNGPELPIMDGSAWLFLFLTECAGIIEQDAPRRAIEILEKVSVGTADRSATLLPGRGFSVGFTIDYEMPAIAHQEGFAQLSAEVLKSALSRARTYGFLHEVDSLRAAGLARGASLDNAIVVNGADIINQDGLRYRDGFVRHKMLDAGGSLYLAGAPLIGRFVGFRSGHRLNHQLLRALFARRDAWRWVTPGEIASPAEVAFYRPGEAAESQAATA